jgi:hypothetical protein
MKYSLLFFFILYFCWLILNDSFDICRNAIKCNLVIGAILAIVVFIQITINFFKNLNKMVLVTTVDFSLLEAGQVTQDTQLPFILAVEGELQAAVQPALDDVTAAQAKLAIDQAAVVAAQAVLDAANATVAATQTVLDAAIVTYNFKATDYNAWIAANNDIKDDAANVQTMKDIYLRNGGTL